MLQPSNVKLTQLERIFEMRTGKQYRESRRDGRKVYVGGEIIEDVTTHPMTKGYANAIAEYYDLHLKPENEEICTFIDDKGNRQSMHWFIPKSKEDVIKRRKYTEFLCRHFKGGIFTRPRSEEHTSELQSLMRISYAVF